MIVKKQLKRGIVNNAKKLNGDHLKIGSRHTT